MNRPPKFRLNYGASLFRGLAYAMLGRHAGTLLLPDSGPLGYHGTLQLMDPPADWVYSPELCRWWLDFDGVNDVARTTANIARVTGAAHRTLAWWAKANTTGNGVMVCTGSEIAGRLFAGAIIGGNWYVHGYSTVNYDTGVAADTNLHHHAVTYDGTTVRWYMDGVELGAGGAAALDTTTAALRIGSRTTGFPFGGKVGDVLLYDWVLPAPLLQALADPSNVMLRGLGPEPLLLPPRRKSFPAVAASPAFRAAWASRVNTYIGMGT